MLADFEAFSANRAETNLLTDLAGATVAIEAKLLLQKYFDKRDIPNYDALISALGGLPIGLAEHVKPELRALTDAGIKPVVVFDGIETINKFRPFARTNDAAARSATAWDFYLQSQKPKTQVKEEAVLDSFRNLDWARVESAYRLLQVVLREEGIPFLVAPYSANGQIAHLYKNGTEFIDAVAGTPELLLYDVDKVIISFQFDKKQFTWVRKQQWIDDLAATSHELFVDGCMLAGTDDLEPLHILNRKSGRINEVLMHMSNGKNGAGLCKELQDNPVMIQSDYYDRFARNRLAVKHHVVLTTEGRVEPSDAENIPGDLHQVLGQRISDELYHYLSTGAIGSRLLSNITSYDIYEVAPWDGGVSDEYRKLIRNKLVPIKQTSLSLLALSLHRAYQYKQFTVRYWFDEDNPTTFKPGDIPRPDFTGWKVSNLGSGATTNQDGKPSLRFAVQSVSQPEFAESTIRTKESKTLKTKEEIMMNSIWRLLQARGYVDASHNLTQWGKVLQAILVAFGSTTSELEEAAILATELLRFDLLNSKRQFPSYAPQAVNGDESHHDKCLLLSRVAALGKLQNRPSGFTGRLSRSILGFNSMVAATQSTLRDLLESCFATLMLNGDAARENIDFTAVGLDLPFLIPLNSALALAVNLYLEEISPALAHAKSQDERDARIEQMATNTALNLLPGALDLEGDLKKAWRIFHAVRAGVKVAAESGLLAQSVADEWDETAVWLAERTPV